MGKLVALLVAAVIGLGIYYYAARGAQPGERGAPLNQAVVLTGVRNDLNAIARAQRIYRTEHGRYGTLEELLSSAALSLAPRGRDGYEYTVQAAGSTFTITARYARPGELRWPTLVIDQTMRIREE